MPTLKLFTRSDDEWEGLQAQFPILVGRGQSFMAHGSLGLLPQPKNETTYSMIVPVKWVRGRIQFEIAVMKASMRSSGAFARANEMLMNRLIANIADEKNRMLCAGNGVGIFAQVNGAVSASTTVTVDNPGNITSTVAGARYIQPGMLLGFIDSATAPTTIQAIREVSSVAAGDLTFVIDSAATISDDYFIVRVVNAQVSNIARDTSWNNEPMGLQGIVATTTPSTFHNIDRSTVTDFQSSVLSVSALSLDALQRLEDVVDQQSGEEITDHLVHHSVRRQYLAMIDASRVFMQTGKATVADAGQEPMGVQLTYNGKPILCDRDFMLGEWMAVNRNHLTHFVLTDGEWAEETGSMFRAVPGQDALEAVYRIADNFSTDKGNAHGKLTGLSTSNALSRHVA